jgi:hypothetical protein
VNWLPLVLAGLGLYVVTQSARVKADQTIIDVLAADISETLARIGLKGPGNAPSVPNLPSSIGIVDVDPAGPPSTVTPPAQGERARFVTDPESGYLPNLGDPNMAAWDYLASTPTDLAWNLSPVNLGGVPESEVASWFGL